MSYELQDFNKEVIEESAATPVVIDFWAEWCGSCRQLSPIIEKLAKEANGKWKLVKVDTEKHPDLAVQFGVRGIPAVKMVYQKEIIAEFTGAQPEHLVRKWLQENLPSNGTEDGNGIMEQVKKALGKGDRKQARGLLKEEVSEDSPDEIKVRYGLLLLPSEIEEASKWIEQVEIPDKYDIELEALSTVRHLGDLGKDFSVKGSNERAVTLYREATEALIDEKFEEAIKKFIECLQIDRELDDDGARKACIACFRMLSDFHPLTQKYRRQFSMSLY